MLRVLAIVAMVVLMVAGALLAGALGVRAWLATDNGQNWLRAEISSRSGLDVNFARLSGPLPWGVDLDEPRLASRDGKLHARASRAELRWSLASLLARDPWVRVRLVQPSARLSGRPSLPHLPLRRGRVQLRVEGGAARGEAWARWDERRVDVDGSFRARGMTGKLAAHGPVDAVDLDGQARLGRGRMALHGRAALAEERARLKIRFRNLEPPLATSRDRMILSGVSRVAVNGRRARFYVVGQFRHRRIEPYVSVVHAPVPGGLVEGSGTLRLRRRLSGALVLNLYDRGHAARLLASSRSSPSSASPGSAPQKVVLRGRIGPRLQMHLESK
jgi:hypothetical protein